MKPHIEARIGMVNFINTAPLYEVWKTTVDRPEWLITEAVPSVLNRLLHAGELDFGLVSSHEYAVHAPAYYILDDLSISSSGPVGSVFLFAGKEAGQLDGLPLVLSPQSQTSNSLVKIILEDFVGVRPRYLSGAEPEPPGAARLAIGDEALRLAQAERYPVRLDLGEMWLKYTGLPFVFAVWAVRRDFCDRHPRTVTEVHQELRRCVREGRELVGPISRSVAGRIPMPAPACERYLRGMEYDLGKAKKEALIRFFTALIARSEARPKALPLRIIP